MRARQPADWDRLAREVEEVRAETFQADAADAGQTATPCPYPLSGSALRRRRKMKSPRATRR